MKHVIIFFSLLYCTATISNDYKTTVASNTNIFEAYKKFNDENNLQTLQELIAQVETHIQTHKLSKDHELSHFLQHLYEHKDQYSHLNTKAVPVCSISNCALRPVYLNRLFSDCITSENFIVNNDAIITGGLCVAGGINGSLPANVDYFFAFSTDSQFPEDSFTPVFFNNIGYTSGNWSYDSFTGEFSPGTGGFFLVTYHLFYKKATIPPSTPFTGTIAARLTFAGSAEYPGSQSSIRIDTTDSTTATLSNAFLKRSIIIYILPGQTLTVQHTTSSNPSGEPVIYLEPDGLGDMPTSASLSIIQLKVDSPS